MDKTESKKQEREKAGERKVSEHTQRLEAVRATEARQALTNRNMVKTESKKQEQEKGGEQRIADHTQHLEAASANEARQDVIKRLKETPDSVRQKHLDDQMRKTTLERDRLEKALNRKKEAQKTPEQLRKESAYYEKQKKAIQERKLT